MKKFTAIVLLMAALLLALPGCLPVDGEPGTGGAGMAGESRAAEPYEPETIEGWGEGMSSFGAYSWNGALLEEVTKELGPGCSQLCWIDDQTVTAVFGEEVFADGVCHEGIFKFSFYSRQEDSELAAAAGLPEEDLELWSRKWSWQRYRNLLQSWELAVTYEPLPEGQWVTPNWWLPPEGLTGKGEDTGDGPWPDIAGPFDADGNPLPTPEPTPFPEDRQAVEDFKFPGWEPAEGHEGYEIAAVHSTPEGKPLQIRLRWKNEEGYGCWVQIPAYALDTFWEHKGEWFVMVGVCTDKEENESTPDPNAYDPVVSSPNCSDHNDLREIIIKSGLDVPSDGWWINEEKVQEIFEIGQPLSAGCRDGIVNFSFGLKGGEELARVYGVSLEELPYQEMKEWPWKPWAVLISNVELYVTLNPREEPVERDSWTPREGVTGKGGDRHFTLAAISGPFDADGNPIPTTESTSFPEDRQPVEDYTPPEWEPVKGYPGYEMAVVAVADNGVPLQVRLRWQREGCQFAAVIPGHCLDTFLERGDELWERVKLRAPGEEPEKKDDVSAVASVRGE